MQGIYGLFASDECLYVGQSIAIERRVQDHLRKLEGGRHPLKSLQAFAASIGEPLVWRVLEEVEDLAMLSRLELFWFEKLQPRFYGHKPSPSAQ